MRPDQRVTSALRHAPPWAPTAGCLAWAPTLLGPHGPEAAPRAPIDLGAPICPMEPGTRSAALRANLDTTKKTESTSHADNDTRSPSPEQVAAFDRNAWPRSIGFPGRSRRSPQMRPTRPLRRNPGGCLAFWAPPLWANLSLRSRPRV